MQQIVLTPHACVCVQQATHYFEFIHAYVSSCNVHQAESRHCLFGSVSTNSAGEMSEISMTMDVDAIFQVTS